MRKILSAVLLFSSVIPAFPQGAIVPSGTPGPIYKTLDQVEPRIIINATNTPGNASSQFIISSSGSYYLTGNSTGVTGKTGITVSADNVTIDLNGFALIGVSGAQHGINGSGRSDVHVRNGTVRNWPNTGVAFAGGGNNQFDHLRLSQNGTGLNVGAGSLITDVSAETTPGTGGTGISAGVGSILTRCAVFSYGTGYSLNTACVVTSCFADGNSTGFSSSPGSSFSESVAYQNLTIGFNVGDDSTLRGCSAIANGTRGILTGNRSSVVNCVANGNGTAASTDAINAAGDSLIKNCVASNNTGNGIKVTGNSVVLENQCHHNSGDGIVATGSVNRIDSNHTNLNTGIGINAGNDWVVRNSFGANTGGNIVGAGADIAPSQTAATATNPFANMP